MTSETLNQLVAYLTEEKKGQNEAIQSILLISHPAFQKIKNLLNIPYRVFFTNIEELSALLKVRGFSTIDKLHWDSPEYQEWFKEEDAATMSLLKVAVSLFDKKGRVKIISRDEWQDNLIRLEVRDISEDVEPADVDPDDIPF